MKKTLVAIAALAAFGAQAQSSVSITGNIDFAASNVTGTQLGSNASTVSTTTGTSSTSVIKFTAVEDLGNGLKVTGLYGIDPRTLSNDAYGVTSADATHNTATGLSRDELYVGLSGNFGNVRLGSPNSIGLETTGASSPLGTATGSGYAPNSGTVMNSVVNTRYNRSVRYDSPTIAGFTASVLYAPGNDVAQLNAAVPLQVQNARKTTELGLAYANGPLSLKVATIQQGAQDNKTGWYSGAYDDQLQKTKATVFGASYAIANTTLYYGYNTGDRLAAVSTVTGAHDGTPVKSKGQRFAVKQTVGQVDLMAQYTTQKAATASATGVFDQAEAKAKVTGVTALYNLSKTAATYIAYEKYDTGLEAAAGTNAATAGLTGDRKIVSIGLRKSF